MTLASDLATRSQTLGQQLIANLSPFYEGGVFWMSNMSDYHRMGLPAAGLMATLARYTTSDALKADYVQKITEIVEFSITTNLYVDGTAYVNGGVDPYGWFGQLPDNPAMNDPLDPNANTTIEQAANIGWILYQLPSDAITYSTRSRWTSVLQACASRLDNWFDGGKITTYYINGNYNSQLLAVYWLAALASSGAARTYYQDCYERGYEFLVTPVTSSAAWTGWGLTRDVTGSENDWSDAQSHLTETNTRVIPGPDFDWNYSAVQMNALSRIFVANRDSRIIRLINSISNKVEPRIDPITWIRNGAGGSRTTNTQGMVDSYYPITALLGSKSSGTTYLDSAHILSMWDTASTGFSAQYLANSTNGLYSSGLMAGLSMMVAPIRHAAGIVVDGTVAAT